MSRPHFSFLSLSVQQVIDTIRYNCIDNPLNCGKDEDRPVAEGQTLERQDALNLKGFAVVEGSPGIAIEGFDQNDPDAECP